jgi:hypothetical protein
VSPSACMAAYIVVGPTKRNPSRSIAFDKAVDSGVADCRSPNRRGAGRLRLPLRGGSNDHTNAASVPYRSCTSTVARAFAMVASILPRWRTMSASPSRRSTSRGPYRATLAGTKPANARRKPSRLRRIVSHDRPDWNPSRQIFSYMRTSSMTGLPHSSSWYVTYSGVDAAHPHRLSPSSPRRRSGFAAAMCFSFAAGTASRTPCPQPSPRFDDGVSRGCCRGPRLLRRRRARWRGTALGGCGAPAGRRWRACRGKTTST